MISLQLSIKLFKGVMVCFEFVLHATTLVTLCLVRDLFFCCYIYHVVSLLVRLETVNKMKSR